MAPARASLLLIVTLASVAAAQQSTIGTFVDGRYKHTRTGVTFVVPAGWSVLGGGPSSDGGEMVLLADSVSGTTLAIWLIRTTSSAGGIATDPAERYRDVVTTKVGQRHAQGLRDYRVHPDSVHQSVIGGRLALVALAEFTQNRQRLTECLTWIDGSQARAFFFTRTPVANLAPVRARFDELVATAAIP